MKRVGIRRYNSARILYLRTFKDMTSDHALVISLAMIISAIGRLVVIGSRDSEIALQAQWQKRFGNDLPFSDHIEYKQSDDSQWRRLVHQEISQADCVLLFMEPKGSKFPRLRPPKIGPPKIGKGFIVDYIAQTVQQSTGSGLLHEIAYLERLRKIKRTIVLCQARNTSHVRQLIYQSSLHLPAGFVFAKTRRGHWRAPTPRFSALDMQVGTLRNAAGVVEFRYKDLKNLHSQFPAILKSTIERVCSKPRAERTGSGARAVLLGRSDKPRRLPPDGKRKIIQFTNVEDIVRIPPLELIEVSHDEVPSLLSEESTRSCPYCERPLVHIFFYVLGLHRNPDDEFVLGRCQRCFGWVGIEDGILRSIGVFS
jgi:hypothetical protein